MKAKVNLTISKNFSTIIEIPEEIAKIYAIPEDEQTSEQWWAIQDFEQEGLIDLVYTFKKGEWLDRWNYSFIDE